MSPRTIIARLLARPYALPYRAEDFTVGQQVRLCNRAFDGALPIGTLLEVTGFHHERAKTYVMITPVYGTGDYGVFPTDIEPHACPDCPHAIHSLGFVTDYLV